VSRYQKGKTDLDFTEARDSEWQWHQLGHMQVCTSQSRQLRQTKQKQNKCPLNSIFSRTTWVGQYQKGKTIVDFYEAN